MTTSNDPEGRKASTVQVEYDYGSKGERRTKEFEDPAKAKKFILAKERAGKNPKVLEMEGAAASTSTSEGRPKTKEQPTAKKKDRVPGVRPMRTRTYLAGTIIAKHGLAAGVTEEMVAELDAAYGKPNPSESQFCLKNAWHVCRAFSGVAEDAIE
ncbi:hypothetical protein DRQ50_06805 [bacterium]|nr:MAG: hypothetical protein DRQ50_06805 [bacterium]